MADWTVVGEEPHGAAAPAAAAQATAGWNTVGEEPYSASLVAKQPEPPAKQFGLKDTWPARVVQSLWSGFTLPHDVLKDSQRPAPTSISDSDVSPMGVGRVLDLASAGSPVNPMVRSGDKAIPGIGMATSKAFVAPPTAEALGRAADAGFDAVRASPVQIRPDAMRTLAQQVEADLHGQGVFPEHAPTSFSVLGRLQNAPDGATIGFPGIHAARMAFGKAGKVPGTQDALASSVAINALDKYIADLPQKDILAGAPAAQGSAKSFNEALGNYAAKMRSDRVTGAEERADLNAAVAGSGQNAGNSLRQRFRDIVVSPKQSRGFNDAELSQAEKIARGNFATDALRVTGNVLGGGGGLGTLAASTAGATTGFQAGGIPGMLLGALTPVAGFAAKKASNSLTREQVRILDELTRMRSPLHQQALQSAPMQVDSPLRRSLMARGIGLAAD